MAKKQTGKSKKAASKVSYNYKPDNMTLEQWQIALRRQAAEKEDFGIQEMNLQEYPGYYIVNNPVSHNTYRVVYRGAFSAWCATVRISWIRKAVTIPKSTKR